MGYVRTGDDTEQKVSGSQPIYHAPGEDPVTTTADEPARRESDEPRSGHVTTGVFTGGASLEAIGGAGAIALAIIGLSAAWPMLMAGIATLAVGGALLFHGGAIATRWHQALAVLDRDRYDRTQFVGGIGAEVFGGVAGIVLGILVLGGVTPALLLPIAAIVFGGSLLLGGAAAPELESLAEPVRENRRLARATHEAMQASGGVMALAGIAAAVLGIIALVKIGPFVTLSLVAMLCVGGALLVAGGALTARFARRLV